MSSIILKSLAIAAVVATAAPAFAAPGKTLLRYDAKQQKYCAIEPAMTGSHIQRTTCLTAAQWSANGLDMPKTLPADTTLLAQK
ncbi:hypothetical protein [Sphingomonas sp. R86520]|uniref:hypothetical protein n=1 Tax=Sphingomonas sp. R86520 TaxID=3093859 RepID=UPI0036D422E8